LIYAYNKSTPYCCIRQIARNFWWWKYDSLVLCGIILAPVNATQFIAHTAGAGRGVLNLRVASYRPQIKSAISVGDVDCAYDNYVTQYF